MILLQPNDNGPDVRITLGPQRETHRLFHIGGHADQRAVVLEVPRAIAGGVEVKQRQAAVNARVKRALRIRIADLG